MEYSYSFCFKLEQEWEWSERYPNQSEILKYLNHVADRFELRSNIRFNTRLLAANFSEKKDQWNLDLDTGNQLICRFLLMATGCLSIPNFQDPLPLKVQFIILLVGQKMKCVCLIKQLA